MSRDFWQVPDLVARKPETPRVPAKGIFFIVISNYLKEILLRFRPHGYDIPNFKPLIINGKR